jgi:hypothetical protein
VERATRAARRVARMGAYSLERHEACHVTPPRVGISRGRWTTRCARACTSQACALADSPGSRPVQLLLHGRGTRSESQGLVVGRGDAAVAVPGLARPRIVQRGGERGLRVYAFATNLLRRVRCRTAMRGR